MSHKLAPLGGCTLMQYSDKLRSSNRFMARNCSNNMSNSAKKQQQVEEIMIRTCSLLLDSFNRIVTQLLTEKH